MPEVLDYYMPKINQSDVVERLGLQENAYFIVSAHREENVDSPGNLADFLDTLNALAERYGYPIIVSTHPRTRKRLESLDRNLEHPLIQYLKPFGFLDYVRLQMSAYCVLSDSGTITEEAALLNLPAITIRNAHERPEGMDVGTLVMSGLQKDRVLEAVEMVVAQHNNAGGRYAKPEDYSDKKVSRVVVRAVLSYTDYVNRTVWHKA